MTTLISVIQDIGAAGAIGWVFVSIIGLGLLILLAAIFRADRTVANLTLSVITLAAFTLALTTAFRSSDPRTLTFDEQSERRGTALALPALACVDDLAGEPVLSVCERALFASADTAAASVSYAGDMISRLVSHGDVTVASKDKSVELNALRRAVERDRYGLIAQVLMSRHNCSPSACGVFSSLNDPSHITANMQRRKYDETVGRYAASWRNGTTQALPVATTPSSDVGVLPDNLPPSAPTGRPSTIDFPTADSIPPVTIMTTEPAAPQPPAAKSAVKAAEPAKRPLPKPKAAPSSAAPAPSSAPVQLAPTPR